jgi:hypothetical protein
MNRFATSRFVTITGIERVAHNMFADRRIQLRSRHVSIPRHCWHQHYPELVDEAGDEEGYLFLIADF